MKKRLIIISVFNLLILIGAVLVHLKLDFVSQFAALLLIFLLPAAGLVLFSGGDLLMKIARGFAYSTLISIVILGLFVLLSIPVTQVSYFAALVLAGNAFLAFGLARKKEIRLEKQGKSFYLCAALVVIAAACLSFWGATRVVPVLQDHDAVMECPAYGLAKTFKPYCIETRVPFYFAKGPTSHFIYAFPLLLTDNLERVKHYYETSKAALDLPDFRRNIVRMWHVEFKRWFPRQGERVIIETRTTSLFISLMLAILLFSILAGITRSGLLAALLTIAFLTLPEIFVRNSYAGYQNISNFFLLLALYQFIAGREEWLTPLLVATTNQKCVLVLGLAVIAWLLLNKSWLKAFTSRTLVGLLIGMLLLYAYGMAIHPPSLVEDQFQRHDVDRLLHQNPIQGMEYPSLAGLWSMFAFNYGYPFLLLALLSLALLARNRQEFPRAQVLILLIASTAAIFSIVDWKMTKHLDLMVPALMMAIAYGFRDRWWQALPRYRAAILATIALVLANNAWIITRLAQDFSWLKVTPIW